MIPILIAPNDGAPANANLLKHPVAAFQRDEDMAFGNSEPEG